MRTIDLIKSFTEQEVITIAKLVTAKERPSLLRLFNVLMDTNNKPVNADLFQKTFQKTYSKKQDYLLRNELRLLNEILYQFLTEQTIKKHLQENKIVADYWLARGYYDRKINNLFKTDIDAIIADAEQCITASETLSPAYSPALLSIKSLWMIDNQPRLLENLELQLETIHKCKQEEKRRFLYRLREMEAREAFIQKQIRNMTFLKEEDDQTVPTLGETIIDFSDVERGDIFIEYSLLKKHTAQTTRTARIETLQKTQRLLLQSGVLEIVGNSAYTTVLNQLGMEYIFIGKFIEANSYFEESITFSLKNKMLPSYSVIHNYLANQLNSKDYQKGIEIYEQYKDIIEGYRLKNNSRLFTAYCHLYLGHEEEAINMLPIKTELPQPLQIIMRFVYVIVYLIREEFELAENEVQNLKRTIRGIKVGNYDTQLEIANLFYRYANALNKKKVIREKLLIGLKQEMEQHYDQWLLWAGIDVHLHWLMKRLDAVESHL